MRIVESKDAFECVKLGRFTYYRKSRTLMDSTGLALFTLKHVDSVIFEKLIVNSSKGIKSPNNLLISIGWPDRTVTLSSLTMKITSLRKMLLVTGFDIVSIKNVGYYIPELPLEALVYDLTEDDDVVEVVHKESESSDTKSLSFYRYHTFTASKYVLASFCLVIFAIIIINWDR